MCAECPPEVLDLAKRIGAYIERNNHVIAGGLHIVIEDENVETDHIQWCVETQNLDEESKVFAAELLDMPAPYRHVVVRMAWEAES